MSEKKHTSWFDWEKRKWLREPKQLLADYESACLIAAAPELFDALEATETAEDIFANCDECNDSGAESAEIGCERCFNLADNARLKRRAILAKLKDE